MKKIVLGLSAAALLATGGIAAAQQSHDADHAGNHAANHAGGHMAKLDADGDGRITRDETIAGVDAMFARMDADRNGRIDAADRAALHEKMRGRMWERLDGDDDGSVSKAEWDAAQAARQAKRSAREAKRADRRAKRAERHAAGGDAARGHRAMTGGRKGRGMAMLRMADANDDRAVTLDEARAAAAKHFATIDADGDGVATSAEMQAMHARHAADAAASQDD